MKLGPYFIYLVSHLFLPQNQPIQAKWTQIKKTHVHVHRRTQTQINKPMPQCPRSFFAIIGSEFEVGNFEQASYE